MTDTTITFDDIVNLGKKRVDDVTAVPVESLGGSIKLRQISGAQQDAAVAMGHAAPGGFDAHVVAREQIKASMVEPVLPPDELNDDGTIKRSEANEILDNLPVKAFGEIQSLVQANSGLLPGVGVEQLVAMFRGAGGPGDADGPGANGDHGADALVGERLGGDDADSDDGVAGEVPLDRPGAEAGSEAAGEDRGAAEAVNA